MKKLSRVLGILLIAVGLLLIGSRYLNNYYVAKNQEAVSVSAVTAEHIQANTKNNNNEDAEFDFADVRNVSTDDVQQAYENIANSKTNVDILGAVAIPNAGINVSVLKGLGDEALLSGAGTFYPDQQMGVGNYPLASHNMIEGDQLLSPIITEVEMGDKIYLTDLDKIYVFETNFIEAVDPSRVDLVAPKSDLPMITLMTCDNDLVHRFIVQGVLVEEMSFSEAPADVVDLFL